MSYQDGDKGICNNCDKEIVFYETPIDNFWGHVENQLAFCDETKNMLTAENWAEPLPARPDNKPKKRKKKKRKTDHLPGCYCSICFRP